MHAVFQVINGRDELDIIVIPQWAQDELTTFVAFSSFEIGFRAEWSGEVASTDDSSGWCAVITAREVPEVCAEVMRVGWEFWSKKRSYVRCINGVDDALALQVHAAEALSEGGHCSAALHLPAELEDEASVKSLLACAHKLRKLLKKLKPSVSKSGVEDLAALLPDVEAEETAAREEAERRINALLEQHVAEDAAWLRADARAKAWFADFARSAVGASKPASDCRRKTIST